MHDRTKLALEATRRLRQSPALRQLGSGERDALVRDLARIESTLGGEGHRDPYALSMATPADLQRELAGPITPSGNAGPAPSPTAPAPAAVPAPTARRNVDQAGRTTSEAVESVNFPGFVAGLIHGTFQAIVDATAQQLREYADLVGSLSRSVDDFSRDNVSPDQTRAWLAARHPADLRHEVPPPGKAGEARLVPVSQSDGQSPAWLEQYGLAGQELTADVANGPLMEAGQRRLGEERLQTLATMVLMGINRIVVNDGDIRAKVQIYAVARDKTDAELVSGSVTQGGIASRTGMSAGPAMMVQTVRANAQAEANVKTNLTGEVRISFKTETFPLERFADSAAIQLLNRHARWRGEGAPAGEGAASPATGKSSGPSETRS